MPFRPPEAHWFETYVPRNETVYALKALADTGVVQLEQDHRLAHPMDLETVSMLIDRFQTVRSEYRSLLPAPGNAPGGRAEAPEETARHAVDCLENWQKSLEKLLLQQKQLESERSNLMLVRECITAIRAGSHDVQHLLHKGGFLYKGVFACPRTEDLPADICASIDEFISGEDHNFFIIVDEAYCHDIIIKAYKSKACQSVDIPDWLPDDPEEHLARIDAELSDIVRKQKLTQQALEVKHSDPAVAAALADIDLLNWYLKNATELTREGKLCHVTGWTTAENVDTLQLALDDAGIQGVIRYARHPGFCKVPVNMCQPWWAMPFLFIVQMLGTPDRNEIDTSKLLPFIVPLLFGYMFPDVGHGLMLVIFSAVMYRRWPTGRLLIPCGLSAMFFGLVFGEVFGIEHAIEPLWVSPLEKPLDVLIAPLWVGIGLIQLGLVFNGAEAVWRGEIKNWLAREAAIMVLYPAILVGLFVNGALWVAGGAAVWFLAGQIHAGDSGPIARLGKASGMLLQASFELLQNTLSFLRVGAFALAHAALSMAVLGMTAGITNEAVYLLMLIFGHIFIVTLEGLVVFVQTTRLVLLEFFIHFLRAEGRMFSPLVEPSRDTVKSRS